MNPVEPRLPDIILDDSDEPDDTRSGLRRASQEELDQMPEVSLQTGFEIGGRAEQLCPTEPRPVMDGSTRANSDQRPVPQKASIHTQDSALRVPALSPGAGSQLGFIPLLTPVTLTPCPPPHPGWPSPIASTPYPRSGFSPVVLVSSPVEIWCGPHLVVLLPEVRPSCYSCPEVAAVHHQPRSPDLLSRAAQKISEQVNAAPRREQTREVRQKVHRPGKEKLQANNADEKTRKRKLSPGSPPERAFEEYMAIMDSLSPKIREAKENENEEEGNSLFLEYMEELCSDEAFVENVETTLNTEYLLSLLSADPEPIHLPALEEQEQEVGSTLKTEHLRYNICSDLEPTNILPRTKSQHKPLRVLQQRPPPSAESNRVPPVTKETSAAPSSLRRAPSPLRHPPGPHCATTPPLDGQNAPLSARNRGPKEGRSGRSTLVSSGPPEETLPTNVMSHSSRKLAAKYANFIKKHKQQAGKVRRGGRKRNN